MTFDEEVRADAQALLDAMAAQAAKKAHAELDALRAEIDVRTIVLEKALSSADHSTLLANHVAKLTHAAREASEALAAKAREEAEAAAAEALSSAEQHARTREDEIEKRAEAARVAADERLTAAQRERDEAQDRIRAVDAERAQLLLALEESRAQIRANEDAFLALFGELESAIRAIHRAATPNDILDTLLEHIGEYFEQTAVLYAGRNVRGWRTRRAGVTADFGDAIIPDSVASLVTRVVSDREWLRVAPTGDEPLAGLTGGAIANAVALPLCANGRVLAIVYAEDAREGGVRTQGVGLKVAEILVEQATRRLTKRTQAKAGTEQYSSPRQARRVKLQASVDITLDGSASFLVDLSSLGAQVLSPLALRPNRVVQMELVGGSQTVQCTGRVVWAFFEQTKGAALYRAGVQFTDVDSHALDSFLAGQGVPQEFPRSLEYPRAVEKTAS